MPRPTVSHCETDMIRLVYIIPTWFCCSLLLSSSTMVYAASRPYSQSIEKQVACKGPPLNAGYGMTNMPVRQEWISDSPSPTGLALARSRCHVIRASPFRGSRQAPMERDCASPAPIPTPTICCIRRSRSDSVDVCFCVV
jgi:hypothetical protein